MAVFWCLFKCDPVVGVLEIAQLPCHCFSSNLGGRQETISHCIGHFIHTHRKGSAMFVIGSPQSKMGIQMKHEQGWVGRSSCIYFTQTPAHKMVFQRSRTESKKRLKILSLVGTGSTQNPKSAANCSEFQGEHMVLPPPPHYYPHWHLWDWKYARAYEKLKKVLEEIVLLNWQHPLSTP